MRDYARMGRRMRRGRRGDRGMHYGYGRDYRGGDYEYDSARYDRTYSEQDNARGGRNYESGRQYDMAYDYPRMRDEHYGSEGCTYYPMEAMGRFTGYYGMPEKDYARGRGRGYDYGYDYAGDYGEGLTKDELEEWKMKLDREVGDEQSKQFFRKENIEQKAKQMGIEMKKFNAEELALSAYMLYSDYCKSLKPYVGQNMDVFIKMGEEFLNDPDSAVKGAEKLALYFDIVSGEDD